MPSKELMDWISDQRSKGFSNQQMYSVLIQRGYFPTEANEALNPTMKVASSNIPRTVPPTIVRTPSPVSKPTPIVSTRPATISPLNVSKPVIVANPTPSKSTLTTPSSNAQKNVSETVISNPTIESRNLVLLLLLCILSFGVYIPFWHNTIRKNVNKASLKKSYFTFLLFFTILVEIFLVLALIIIPMIDLPDTMLLFSLFLLLLLEKLIWIFGILTIILIFVLVFKTRNVLSQWYPLGKQSTPPIVLMNIIYLQMVINNENKKRGIVSTSDNKDLKLVILFLILFIAFWAFVFWPA